MKKIRILYFVLVFALLLSSCSKQTFVPQNITGVNYNNYLYADFDSFCFTDNAMYNINQKNLYLALYKRTTNGEKFLRFAEPSDGALIAYEGIVYYFRQNDGEDDFILTSYDENTGKFRDIQILGDIDHTSYFIKDDCIYYYPWDTEGYRKLRVYSLKTEEIKDIAGRVETAGVMGDTVVYVTLEDGSYFVYAYNYEENTSDLLGELSVEEEENGFCYGFNFTAEYVVIYGDKITEFPSSDKAQYESVIYVYDLKQRETISSCHMDRDIITFIAYENYAFFAAREGDDVFTLNRIQLENAAVEEIKNLSGVSASINVTSDEDVYVCSLDTGKITHYTADGEETIVSPDK